MIRCTVILGAGAVYEASGEMNDGKSVSTESITCSLYTQYDNPIEFEECITLRRIVESNEGPSNFNFEDVYELLMEIRDYVMGVSEDQDGSIRKTMEACGLKKDATVGDIDRLINRLLQRVLNSITPYDEKEPPAWFSGFFSRLESLNDDMISFDFCVLNYDTWVEKSLNRYNDGFVRAKLDSGKPDEYSIFRKSMVIPSDDSNRLCHPHGCVNFGGLLIGKPHGDAEICLWDRCIMASRYKMQYSEGDSSKPVLSPIVTGKRKKRNFYYEPFKTYLDLIEGPMASNEIILIIGYGFGDPHINEIIRKYKKKSGKHLIIISPFSEKTKEAIRTVCEYDVEQKERAWTSDDAYAVWFMSGFKEMTMNDDVIETIRDMAKQH